jgi:hypothetical protein
MELQTLQERVQYIENKRTWLRELLADPQHTNLAIDINQALIELVINANLCDFSLALFN